jgi:uncharacterized protein with PIN domain
MRISRAFERRFQELLAELGARNREKGVRWVFQHASQNGSHAGWSLSRALAEENVRLAEKVRRFERRRGTETGTPVPKAFCDAGLGGLARWLRACGCDARWVPDIADGDLVREAENLGAVIITTDSFLLDRRPIAHGRVRAIWVPPTLNKFEQLRLVQAELPLAAADALCMRCGGELRAVSKEKVKERIPPKTYLWIDDYFECSRCGKLFWEGTHWRRVTERLGCERSSA